jgi:replicative DNA helicase
MKVKTVSPRTELMILRGMCSRNKVIAGSLLASVDESYFDTPESREILQSIRKQMVNTGEPPLYKLVIADPELSEETRTFFRDSEASIQTVEDATKAVKILNRYRQNRVMNDIKFAIEEAMSSGRCDIEKLMDDVSSRVVAARTSRSRKNEFLHFGLNNNSMVAVKNLFYGDKSENVIPTMIGPFDEKSGGFLRGGLVTVGATSGSGKSLLACQLAMNFASQGYKVVIVPLEMTEDEMMARIGANLNKVDVTRILIGKLTEIERDAGFAKFKRWMKHIAKKGGRLSIFKPKEDVSLEDVFAAVNAYDADVRIVDYISLLKGADGDDSWQALGAMARLAKVNAGATGTVNVLLCQVNDEGKIRYSRAISEHSTNSWIWVTKKEEREKEVGRIKVEQPKARNSASFPFEIGFNWSNMRVVPIDSTPDTSTSSSETLSNLADV